MGIYDILCFFLIFNSILNAFTENFDILLIKAFKIVLVKSRSYFLRKIVVENNLLRQAEVGLNVLEPVIGVVKNFVIAADEAFIQKIREEMDRLGLKLANLCVDGPHVWVADPEQRAQHKAQMLEYIRAGRQLGAESIRIAWKGARALLGFSWILQKLS